MHVLRVALLVSVVTTLLPKGLHAVQQQSDSSKALLKGGEKERKRGIASTSPRHVNSAAQFQSHPLRSRLSVILGSKRRHHFPRKRTFVACRQLEHVLSISISPQPVTNGGCLHAETNFQQYSAQPRRRAVLIPQLRSMTNAESNQLLCSHVERFNTKNQATASNHPWNHFQRPTLRSQSSVTLEIELIELQPRYSREKGLWEAGEKLAPACSKTPLVTLVGENQSKTTNILTLPQQLLCFKRWEVRTSPLCLIKGVPNLILRTSVQ